jgi:hypothetical protein
MTRLHIEMVNYWTRVEGEEDRVRTFARIPDGYYGETDQLPKDDEVYYWLEAEEWEESLIGKVYGDALVLRVSDCVCDELDGDVAGQGWTCYPCYQNKEARA